LGKSAVETTVKEKNVQTFEKCMGGPLRSGKDKNLGGRLRHSRVPKTKQRGGMDGKKKSATGREKKTQTASKRQGKALGS